MSLYETALQSEPPPQPLHVSPAVFKSILSSVLDVLTEQHLAAALWLRLPRGAAWQARIDRFSQAATAPCTLYLLQVPPNSAPEVSFNPFDAGWLEAPAGKKPMSESIAVPLAAKSPLRHEYFLLVRSERLSCLVLAHRQRPAARLSHRQPPACPAVATEQKQLLGLCCFDPPTIERVAQALRQAIAASPAEAATQAAAALQFTAAPPDPMLMARLLTRQIQQQEEGWRSSTSFRQQTASDRLPPQAVALPETANVKDEFLKMLCQELRTPLTTMKTALSLLDSPMLKASQRQRYMEMLCRECDRQSSLLTSVLELVQLEDATAQTEPPLRLADVVPGVVSTYQPLAQEKGIMLAYTIPENLPAVACPASWLRQIVINLLHNGVKFTLAGGKVWVKARPQGDFVEVEVSDTGIGIAAADLPNIFDRFYRVRHSSEDTGGAGLGLSIVQQLLLRCGGSISVKSKPSEGSTFSVLLPSQVTVNQAQTVTGSATAP